MIYAINCNALWSALAKLGKIIAENEEKQIKTVIFCEDRLTLAAERAVCSAVGGTFLTSVYTFSRFLSSERGKNDNILSKQGSAMAIRKIIEGSGGELKTFKKLTAANAAGQIYDTIALLYSSRISAEDVKAASACGGHLAGKLSDIALIYERYMRYLEESGADDRNVYLRQLAPLVENSPKIRGNCVIFLGFQAFTCTTTECARAAFSSARDVYGLFIGGEEDIYVNEANAAFIDAAKDFGGAKISVEEGILCGESEVLRKNLFNPLSLKTKPAPTENVKVLEAADGEEEMEFIAAAIKKYVSEGERYSKISVMLPDTAGAERSLARAFSRFNIPYYIDRRIPLSEHFLCSFVCDFILCATGGCRPEDVDAVISSPYFPAGREDKDVFRNYALRLAAFRGGVFREPDEEILAGFGFDAAAVRRVKETFMQGYRILEKRVNSSIYEGVLKIFKLYEVERRTVELSEKFSDDYPAAAAFEKRIYKGVCDVLKEADYIAGDLSPKEFLKVLKSGFAATEISLIPIKADAVFVGDISATVNTGSDVVFAARLSGDVPSPSPDTALLTDREITYLEGVKVNVSPKISQVNARRRETTALNICAFRKHLYLTYPAVLGGEEQERSSIINYALTLFCSESGAKLSKSSVKDEEKTLKYAPYYCSEPVPAARYVLKGEANGAVISSAYEVLKRTDGVKTVDAALGADGTRSVSCAKELFLKRDSISPTSLETYFACPYLNFMRQGLRVQERYEGAVNPVDTGNFIHSVLEETAKEAEDAADEAAFVRRAEEIAVKKLEEIPYSRLMQSDSGRYTAQRLVGESKEVCLAAYRQIKNSSFTVARAESGCSLSLAGGVKIYGRIDRVDTCGDMVRIIDYKTGNIDASPSAYYMGEKLQLPLYLLAASDGKRAAGAYYFPASVTFSDSADDKFRLLGFMDGSEDVVAASDATVMAKQKSRFVNAYLGGKNPDSAMSTEDFSCFLRYSKYIAEKGAEEILQGNITPSPAGRACEYCKMGGSCGFAVGKDGESRSAGTVKCADIAEIVRKTEGKI